MKVIQETTLRNLIRFFGSITKMANELGLSRTSIYRYIDGAEIRERIAKRIEDKTGRQFRFKSLIFTKSKYYLELNNFPEDLIKLPLEEICIAEQVPSFSDQKGLLAPQQRAICVDENHNLIYGLEAIENSRKQDKKTILTWRISFVYLLSLSDRYPTNSLVKAFNLFERTAIGMALEKFIGNRQGQRTDLQILKKFNYDNELGGSWTTSQIKKGTKTRTIVSELLDIGDKSYRYRKKILKQGCGELIKQVSQKKISISKAARLAKLTHEEQLNKLKN